MKEQISKRLVDLYKGQKTTEDRLLSSIRYNNTDDKINELINELKNYAGRTAELENLLTYDEVQELKKKIL